MDSGTKDHSLAHGDGFWMGSEVSDNEHFHIVSSQSLAKDSSPYFIFILVGANSLNEITEVRVGIGIAVGEGYSVQIIYTN